MLVLDARLKIFLIGKFWARVPKLFTLRPPPIPLACAPWAAVVSQGRSHVREQNCSRAVARARGCG